MELSLKTSQNVILSPQMELSVKILQMDSTQLMDYLKEVMLENPVMELEPPPEKEHKDELALKKLEWLESMDDSNTYRYNAPSNDEDKKTPVTMTRTTA